LLERERERLNGKRCWRIEVELVGLHVEEKQEIG
jgi:hypothetical protein